MRHTKKIIGLLILFSWQVIKAQEGNLRLSISIPATTLDVALNLLQQESKTTLSYELTRVRDIKVKAYKFADTPLETILKEILSGTKMTFLRRNGNLLIVPRPKQPGTISGYVEDAASGERLIGVSLAAAEFRAGTATNNYGFFSITLPVDSIRLRLSYLGYQPLDTMIHNDTRLTFKLVQDKHLLHEVTIRAPKEERIQESSQMSIINLPVTQIQAMPRFFGEADLMKTLQLLPGVKQGSEGTSALLVRGGTPDQNLILLDGAPLYNPSHFLGIFSTFNTSVLKDVTLYKGAFPARYAGRLSSVVDISTKDGDMHALHGDLSLGLLASQLTLEGPLKKDKTSFVISARRSYPDVVAKSFVKRDDMGDVEKFNLYFYDMNVKLHHKLSDNDNLFLSFYNGRDKMRIRQRSQIEQADNFFLTDMFVNWGNTTGTFRWNHVFSKKLFANTMLLGSRYRFNTGSYREDIFENEKITDDLVLNSGIQDYGAKIDLDYRPHPAHSIRMGASWMYRIFTPGVIREVQTQGDTTAMNAYNENHDVNGSELDAYVEDDWAISSKLKLNAGLHWSGFRVQRRFYNSLQPRLSLRYLLPGDWALKVSYSKMMQYIHLLANNSISLPTDLWVPATKNILPQQADQYAIGLARNVFQNKFEFSLEGYYKRMQNVIEYKEGAEYMTSSRNESWQDQIASGKGEAYGMELLLQKKTGRFTGWFGYTLSWAYRVIPGVSFGNKFPYKYDRRHDLHIVGVYKLRKRVELSGAWTFQSAAPFTVAISEYEGIRNPRPVYNFPERPRLEQLSGRNNIRLTAYHRLDLGVNFIKHKKNGNVRTWNVSVLNAYNRWNNFYFNVRGYSEDGSRVLLTGTALLPLIPSVSYNLKF